MARSPEADRPLISVVVPVKNEEATLPALAREIEDAFAGAEFPWEVIWVDDGSTDGTAALLPELPPCHRFVRLARNQGQSAALMAGVRHSRAEWIGTLDGDGQNVPADLLRQLSHARAEGVQMVNGIRARRRDSLVRRISSRLANRTRDWLTGATATDVGCSTRVVLREALLELPFFHGMHRFLPTLVKMRGYRLAEIPVDHRPRAGGRSKYGIHNRLWAGIRDLFGVRWLLSRNRVWRVAGEGVGRGRRGA